MSAGMIFETYASMHTAISPKIGSKASKQAKTLKSLLGGHAATPHDAKMTPAHPYLPNGSYGS